MSDLTPNQKSVLLALAAGNNISAAARSASIHRATIYTWIKHDPAFQAAVRDLHLEQSAEFEEHLTELSRNALLLIEQTMADPTAPISTRIRIAFQILRTREDQWHARPGVAALLKAIPQAPATPPGEAPAPAPESQDYTQDVRHNATVFTPVAPPPQVSARNAPCSCGSGLKFKRCCGRPEKLKAAA